jgi:cell division protease FtsH
MQARAAILEVHTRDKPLAQDVALDELAAATPGFSGADLANLCNEAALTAVRRGAEAIARQDFLEAQDKIQLGDPSETRLRPEEKRRVAVHESGHALVAQLAGGTEKLRRVTIIPRGMALGATQQNPGEDKHLHTVTELRAMLRVLLGGYAAEQALLGEVSSGAEDDLRKATHLAHKMVAQLGMSDKLGPVRHEHRTEHPFLGQRIASDGGVSDATLHDIELEAQALLERARAEAIDIIRKNRTVIDRLIDRLMVEETLEKEALERIFAEGLTPPSRADGKPARLVGLPSA